MKRPVSHSSRLSLALAAGWMLLAGAVCAPYVPSSPGPAEDAIAPDFSLAAADGAPVSLAELRAKGPVVVVFYRGHW